MANKDEYALVISEQDTHDEGMTFGDELGGFQALVLFLVIVLLAVLVALFPNTGNPSVMPAAPDTQTEQTDIMGTLDDFSQSTDANTSE